MDRENSRISLYWDKILEDERIGYAGRYGGLAIGTAFQIAEHSPDKVESWTGVEVPDSLFQEVLNPAKIDKGVHFYFSYSATSMLLDSIEKSDFNLIFPRKALAINSMTLLGGSAKELSDGFYDLGDMFANIAGSNAALYQHKNRLEFKYEEEMGVEIGGIDEFVKTDFAYNTLKKQEIDPSTYLDGDEPAGI